jgi:hypothetical protein
MELRELQPSATVPHRAIVHETSGGEGIEAAEIIVMGPTRR